MSYVKFPAAQPVQDVALAPEYFQAPQSTQVPEDAAAVLDETFLDAQLVQDVAALAAAYLPPVQSTHDDAPDTAEYLPTGHNVQDGDSYE